MPKATAPVEATTPRKFQKPLQTTANVRIERMGVDDGCDGVGGVMEAVHKFETERDEQRDAYQDVRQSGTRSHFGEVANQIPSDVTNGADRNESEDQGAD
jgi:hypothetical protein